MFFKSNRFKDGKTVEVSRKQQFTEIYEKNLWGGHKGNITVDRVPIEKI